MIFMIKISKKIITAAEDVYKRQALYCIAASTIFFGAFLPSGRIQTSVHRVGNVWLGFLIYLLTYIAASDIIVLILKLINKKKEIPILKKRYGALIIGAAVTVSSFGFTIYGTIHARNRCV